MSRGLFLNTTPSTSFKSQSGQVAVIVFLIMAVLLVVGLSLATRTSQEIELAGQQEDTTRVFNAAESGIEKALSDEGNFSAGTEILNIPSDATTQATTTVTITPTDEYTNTFQPGLSATVFTDNTVAENLTIKWAAPTESGCISAVLVLTAYIQSGSNYSAQHFGLRPQGCYDTTNFTPVNEVLTPGRTHRYTYIFSVPANTKMLRIKPLYAATALLVEGDALGSQMHTIRSEAQDSSTGNTEVRAVEVTRTRPAPPLIFDYALYSGGTLTK